jgi:catechol 2,3-dioxygenase-like lactoylglutathione lyase family enzyme
MDLKSVSGLTLYVSDLEKSAQFYQALGFRIGEQTELSARVYLNWFSLQLVSATLETKQEFMDDAHSKQKGEGLYINIKVDDVDLSHEWLLEHGFGPTSDPRDWPWGNREFVLTDPDGYKLVFFAKAKPVKK